MSAMGHWLVCPVMAHFCPLRINVSRLLAELQTEFHTVSIDFHIAAGRQWRFMAGSCPSDLTKDYVSYVIIKRLMDSVSVFFDT